MNKENIIKQPNVKTALKWLTSKKRYPISGMIGIKNKRWEYFYEDQTKPVRSGATHHPFFNVKPIPNKIHGIEYYYYDECERKRTPNQWLKIGRKVIRDSVPCSGSRSGFNPSTRQHIDSINFFLISDTRKV
jgi:hypothetical protein